MPRALSPQIIQIKLVSLCMFLVCFFSKIWKKNKKKVYFLSIFFCEMTFGSTWRFFIHHKRLGRKRELQNDDSKRKETFFSFLLTFLCEIKFNNLWKRRKNTDRYHNKCAFDVTRSFVYLIWNRMMFSINLHMVWRHSFNDNTKERERNEKINIKLSYLKELKRKYTRLLRNPYILNIDREKIIIIIKNKQTNKSISVILLTKINFSFFLSFVLRSLNHVDLFSSHSFYWNCSSS